MKHLSNLEIAELLRKMAAAYQILNENRFKIIAYDRAADSIEHLTSEVKDLWDDGKLGEIPGVGSTIQGHLDELFKTGKVKHIESVLEKIPESVFPLLLVPGIGPKRAYRLVVELKLKDKDRVIEDLLAAIDEHKVASLEGFGEKSEQDLLANIATFREGAIKEKRILLSEADVIASSLIEHLNANPSIERVDILGSLRRCVATIGDIDIAIITKKPADAIAHFITYPHTKIIEEGPTGASILLHNGRQVDLRVQNEASYGAMLQYFTGSKNHNIALRSYALTKKMSLSEYGIKKLDGSGKTEPQPFESEEAFYKHLGMDWIPPELREDRGEIARALTHTLPKLVETADINGDFHIHTNFNLEPSHDLGVHPLSEILDTAFALDYSYIGISDHNPSVGNHTEKEITSIMKKRHEFYKSEHAKWEKETKRTLPVFIMLEVDIKPDGTLALPEEAFEYVDGVIVSVHSSFTQTKAEMTDRIMKALVAHKKVRILGHPTGRLLGKREGFEADWLTIMHVAKERNIALEINASPYRLDLPDALVFDAVKEGCKLVVNTDAHHKEEMQLMKYGVSVARRGWAEKGDITNTYSYNQITQWFG